MKPPFEDLVHLHGPRLLRVCRAIVGADEADDAWSETLLAALRAYPGLPGDANVEAWLVTIAHRKAIDLVRARNRRALPVGTVPDRPPPHPAADGGRVDVWAAVAALPDKQRHVVAYRYLGGLAHADIAGLVGGTPESSRRAAADGLKTLRARLISMSGEPR